jgi:hypothetical protein
LELRQQRSHLRLVRPEELRGEEAEERGISSTEEISSEEREQILAHIDKFVEQNRLEIKSDTFSITPRQSGLLMPILINICALLLFASGYFLATRFFDQRQEFIVSEAKTLLTAEGKLIEALKRQSQEEIEQKDRQIREIQSRLSDVNGERERLRLDSEAAIRQREQELKAALETELEAERQRLSSTGIPETEMNRRLKELEETRRAEYEAQIADFKRQQEAELAEKDAAIASLAADYQKSLDMARAERLQLQGELERRQAELQAQFQVKEQSLQADRARMLEELGRLQNQQETENLVLDQILAAYERIVGFVRDSQYERALENLQALREFLGQDSVVALPIIQRRRPVELFIIGSLEELIQKTYLGSTDTSSLVASSNLLNEIASKAAEANQAFEAGDVVAAERLYEEALQRIAAAWSSHSRLKEIEKISLAEEQKKLDALIGEGDRLYLSEDYRASVDRYTEAITYLKQDAAVASRIVERIMDSAFRFFSDGALTPTTVAATEAASTEEINPLLLERLTVLRKDFEEFIDENRASPAPSPETLSQLLEAKILMMQIIAAEPVKSQYPELYETIERYFDAFGDEQARGGQSRALQNVISILEQISGEKDYEARGCSSPRGPYKARFPSQIPRMPLQGSNHGSSLISRS